MVWLSILPVLDWGKKKKKNSAQLFWQSGLVLAGGIQEGAGQAPQSDGYCIGPFHSKFHINDWLAPNEVCWPPLQGFPNELCQYELTQLNNDAPGLAAYWKTATYYYGQTEFNKACLSTDSNQSHCFVLSWQDRSDWHEVNRLNAKSGHNAGLSKHQFFLITTALSWKGEQEGPFRLAERTHKASCRLRVNAKSTIFARLLYMPSFKVRTNQR